MKRVNLLVLILVAWPSLHAVAQTPQPFQLIPSNVNADQDYGYSVDLDGDVAVVGGFRDEDSFPLESGAAYVFRFNGSAWVEESRLTASTQESFNWNGWDVAVSGDAVLVSERRGDQFSLNAGDAFVYRYTDGSWTEEDIILPPDAGANDFGFAVDLDGDVAAIGAPFTSGAVANDGAVYVYRKNGASWDFETTLVGSDLSLQAQFGSAVAIEGHRMLIGAFGANDSTSSQAGKMYVYEYDGAQWNEAAVLQSNQSNNLAGLGASVALEGDWAVGGAALDTEGYGSTSGAVLVYRFDGISWNFHSKLFASDGPGFFLFGSSVALSGNRLVVGADNWFPANGNGTGKAYLFEYDDSQDAWNEVSGILPDALPQGANFGHSAAIQGEVMLFGAPEFDDTLGAEGAAFIYGEPLVVTSVEESAPETSFNISSIYPNPFNTATTLSLFFDVEQPARVDLFDALGRKVNTLHSGRMPVGSTSIVFDAGDLPAGAYWLRIQAGGRILTRSITLVR